MKLLVDMNLPPDWVTVLREAGWEAEHWSKIGNPRATDAEIMAWAREHGCAVFTHDLDFGSLLALTQAQGPSVIQVRTQDVTPGAIGQLVLGTLRQFQSELEARIKPGCAGQRLLLSHGPIQEAATRIFRRSEIQTRRMTLVRCRKACQGLEC